MDKIYSKEDLVKKILENDKDFSSYNIDEGLIHDLINGKIAKNINQVHDENLTSGQKAADKIASFGGSWPFIIIFTIVLFTWIIINTIILTQKAFDPYPFILLNLLLSCLAAIQAPIIMMSQNRQSEKDRLTAFNDYLINLKAEIIIEDLHKKIDMLIEQDIENKKNIELLIKKIDKLENTK
ncbi:MAG: DUF1003 domain-containing protein [Clostridiaceae bacterium]